jgi:hypothetical protein
MAAARPALAPLPPGRALPLAPTPPLAAESPHRYAPFLLTALALTLTFGATLGMINLARLTTPYFGTVTPGSVSAHGFVQVFGFVGLFVMGVACHVLPRFAGRGLAAPSLVTPMLVLQAGGVVTIVGAFMLHEQTTPWGWTAGSLALVAAGSIFLLIVWRTGVGAAGTARIAPWVVAGAGWQVAVACGSVVAALRDDTAINQALWPAALWGFAGSWIFGIGRRIFPGFLGWRLRAPGAERAAFGVYQAGVALTVAAAWPRPSGPIAALDALGAVALVIALPLVSWCLGVGTRRPRALPDLERGYQRYVTAAWIWLAVALLVGPFSTLLALQADRTVPRLAADFGRHALAFGFVAQIMMGVATRILPTFTGHPLWSPRTRTATFYLLNASLILRSLEAVVALGFVPGAWPMIALAGPPAAAAVALFALNVVLTIVPVAIRSGRV